MKVWKRTLCLALALLTVLPLLFACKKKGDTDGDGSKEDSVTTLAPAGDELPDTDWMGRTFRVLGRDGGAYTMFTNFEIYSESVSKEVVPNAVWERNNALKEKYNFDISQKLEKDVAGKAQLGYAAGEDNYDLVLYQITKVQAHAQTGYLADLNLVPYLNFDKDCWNAYANKQLTMVGKLYYTVSDFLLSDKNRTYINVYNRELARQENLGYLEDLVTAGKWTLEEAKRLSTLVTKEVNGDNKHTEEDAFGLVMDSYNAFVAFSYGGGLRLSSINKEGEVALNKVTTKTADIISKVIDLTCNTEQAMFCNDYNNWSIANEVFYAERALISTTFPSVFETSLKEKCEFEFGILPFPKYDENQTNYYTIPDSTNSVLFAIPVANQDLNFAGFCLEALSEASTETTLNAFYEVKCKLQDSYDLRCAQMLDLIFANVVYDVVLVGDFGGLASLLKSDLPSKKMNLYASMHKVRSSAAQVEIDKLINDYTAR